jgi:DNA ligase-1
MDIRNFFGAKKAKVEATTEAKIVNSAMTKADKTEDGKEDSAVDKAKDEIETSETSDTAANDSKTDVINDTPVKTSPANKTGAKQVLSPMKKTADNAVDADGSSSIKDMPKELVDFITWKPLERIPYSAVVNTFDAISRVSGRLDKESCFTKLFRAAIHTTPAGHLLQPGANFDIYGLLYSDLDCLVYLASNTVFPAYDGLELGIGDSLLVKAVCEATGRKKDAVEEDYQKEGDLGSFE